MSALTVQRRQDIVNHLLANHAELRELSSAELGEVCREWLQRFAVRVRRQEGSWMLKGFKWHGFSYGIVPCLAGESALRAYQRTKGRFYLFDEEECFGYLCKTPFPFRPDLSRFRTDVYLTGSDFSWTMVFTHEQPEIGPFFAEPDAGSSRRPES
jgi:hypothetical protein